jgi:hypothetical protein
MKCDFCEEKDATINIQKLWVIWKIDDKGNYINPEIITNIEPDENIHLCDECFEDWYEGEKF